MAKFEGIQITFPAKIEIAIGKAEVFAHFICSLVHRKGGSLGLVVYDNGTGKEFDITGVEIAVFCAFVPIAGFAAYFDYTFRFKPGEELG